MVPIQDALIQGALPHAETLTQRLLLFLEAKLAEAIKFSKEDRRLEAEMTAEAVAAGATLRKLTDEEEAAVDRLVWRPVAETCIAEVLDILLENPGGSRGVRQPQRFTDEEIGHIATQMIGSPIGARRIGLDVAQARCAAELTTDLFCDRSQFTTPELLTIDDQLFTIQRDGDTLVVRAL